MPKTQHEKAKPGEQDARSQQSGNQGAQKSGKKPEQESGTGIGSSQGQDSPAPERDRKGGDVRSPGTADVERGASSPGSQDSMVNDMTGAFKERP